MDRHKKGSTPSIKDGRCYTFAAWIRTTLTATGLEMADLWLPIRGPVELGAEAGRGLHGLKRFRKRGSSARCALVVCRHKVASAYVGE